jgi:threonine/homoserine/homoserine lactone efflux protein
MMGIGSILLTAIPTGLAISLSPGAALFGIIQTSLSKGFKSGISFAIGISISDMLFIALCLWGLSGLMDNPVAMKVFGWVSGIVLIVYGLVTFFNKKSTVSEKQRRQVAEKRMQAIEERMQAIEEHQQQVGEYLHGATENTDERIEEAQPRPTLVVSVLRPMSKGFLFNLINPCAWVLWLGILPITAGLTLGRQILFFGSILVSIFCIDLIKSYFAGRIKNLIKPNMMFIINRVIGIIFCVLGIYMIVKIGFDF